MSLKLIGDELAVLAETISARLDNDKIRSMKLREVRALKLSEAFIRVIMDGTAYDLQILDIILSELSAELRNKEVTLLSGFVKLAEQKFGLVLTRRLFKRMSAECKVVVRELFKAGAVTGPRNCRLTIDQLCANMKRVKANLRVVVAELEKEGVVTVVKPNVFLKGWMYYMIQKQIANGEGDYWDA